MVLSEMKRCGTRRIQLTGGEPMMRSDLGDIIAHAKRLGLFVGLSTNGYQVAERIDELKEVDVVFLSYDGPPEVHDRLRGRGSVADVRSALRALQEAGIHVWTTTVLTRWNAPHIDDIVAFAEEHGLVANFDRLDYFEDPQGHFHPSLEQIQDLLLGDEWKACFRKLFQLKRSGKPIGSSLAYLQNALEWPYEDRMMDSRPAERYRCWAGRAFGHLEADGMLYACGMGVGRVEGVSVMQEGFRRAWEKIVSLEDCRSCSDACQLEANLIFSLDRSTVLNWLSHL